MIKIGFLKLGNISTSTMIELLLDERAEREDLEVRVISSGANMSPEQSAKIAEDMLRFKPDLCFVVSPNASTKGPATARDILNKAGISTIAVTDGPKKILEELQKAGMGGIIVEADSMIGARREFLDPIEMAVFNSDVIKVLSVTGVFSVIYKTLDDLIQELKSGRKPSLPLLEVTRTTAIEAAGFVNPYAKAKATAAYEISKRVANLTTEACFKEKEWEIYTMLCASAHELMRMAAYLSDEAREVEKYGDNVLRRPHHRDGRLLEKRKLIEKPK
ncbi:F420-dependent methylenetetrahydromethanopterin dehydrogenase [Candidatus Bathyarchaeota archaeon]|nr:F420-dependent methylenetetrahydromethanopterin dehydrogenase [Candidatus Bathyarchaeota archaeon]